MVPYFMVKHAVVYMLISHPNYAKQFLTLHDECMNCLIME